MLVSLWDLAFMASASETRVTFSLVANILVVSWNRSKVDENKDQGSGLCATLLTNLLLLWYLNGVGVWMSRHRLPSRAGGKSSESCSLKILRNSCSSRWSFPFPHSFLAGRNFLV